MKRYVFIMLALLASISLVAKPAAKSSAKSAKTAQSTKVAKPSKTPKIRLTPDNITQIISLLTPEEKAALIVGSKSKQFDGVGYTSLYVPGAAGTTHPVERLGIPAVVLADGPAGVRIKDRPCTKFPIGTSLASTWNLPLVLEVGGAIGNEVKEYGVDVLLAPGVNIHRNPLCGRNFEYYSEDPLLAGKMASAYIKGVQSQGVGTSLKHFAANNQELNRLFLDARVSQRALRELYLRNFEIAVKESSPWTLMTSYNYINGTYAAENKDLATHLLREEWGYDGAVMTDWGGGYDARAIVASGNDMIQPGSDRHYQALVEGLKDGSLSMEAVDKAVEHILKLVVKTPRFAQYAYSNKPSLEKNAQVARKAAREGMVLLKNAGQPLPLDTSETIALLGVASYDFITGGTGSGDVNGSYIIDLKKGLEDGGFHLDEGVDAYYAEYMEYERQRCAMVDGKDKKWYIDAERPIESVPYKVLREAARRADKAIVTIGRVFGEGKDRSLEHSYKLSQGEQELIRAASEIFHAEGKSLIVVLDVGGIVDMASWQRYADAILVCWLPGCEAGHAVADVLSGAENPSGRLPMTIPVAYEDDPTAGSIPQILADKPYNYSFYRRNLGDDFKKRYEIPNVDYVNYTEDIFVGYRYYVTRKVAVSYPFGYGLSYTDFKYGKPVLDEDDKGYFIHVTVENTGEVAGKEVVQLYVKAPGKDMAKPERELKAFVKTGLIEPGGQEEVSLYVPYELLASFDQNRSAWVVEGGKYEFLLAKDAASKPLQKVTVSLEEDSWNVQNLFAADPLYIEAE